MHKYQNYVELPKFIHVITPLLILIFLLSSVISCLTKGNLIGDIILLTACSVAFTVIIAAKQFSFSEYKYIYILILYSLIYSFYELDYTAFKNTLALFSMFTVFAFSSKFGHYLLRSKRLTYIFYAISLLSTILVSNSEISKNLIGGAFFYFTILSFLFYSNTKKNQRRGGSDAYLLVMIAVFALYSMTTGFRSLLLYALLFFLIFYIFITNKPKAIINSLPIFSALTVICLFYLYVNIEDLYFGSLLNEYFEEKTGRQFSSGRQVIWGILYEYLLEKPWFGFGPSTQISYLLGADFSAHNYYLQLSIQLGFFGLALLIAWLTTLWFKATSKHIPTLQRAIGASTLIVFLLHNSLEVLMFQNGTIVAIPAWLVIGLSISAIDRDIAHA